MEVAPGLLLREAQAKAQLINVPHHHIPHNKQKTTPQKKPKSSQKTPKANKKPHKPTKNPHKPMGTQEVEVVAAVRAPSPPPQVSPPPGRSSPPTPASPPSSPPSPRPSPTVPTSRSADDVGGEVGQDVVNPANSFEDDNNLCFSHPLPSLPRPTQPSQSYQR